MPTKILIADDYEDNLELLRLLLVAAGYQVLEASNGAECLELARQGPDLIMVDLSMPILDGWKTFQALRADEQTASIPCIAVTAHGETDRERALQTGFDAYLSKPFRGAELVDTINKLLPSSRSHTPENSLARDRFSEPLLETGQHSKEVDL
jgi:two-component system cell cycle response regulator DivK